MIPNYNKYSSSKIFVDLRMHIICGNRYMRNRNNKSTVELMATFQLNQNLLYPVIILPIFRIVNLSCPNRNIEK